jgi:hypothetical protein
MPDSSSLIPADLIARGVCRAVEELGYAAMTEFPLGNGRRVDVIALNGGGETLIVEVKSCVADFRADRKWMEYLPYCDLFYFAVPDGFPHEMLPPDCGLMVADGYGAAILRPSPRLAMNGNRRRALTLRLALTASQRLRRAVDPRI